MRIVVVSDTHRDFDRLYRLALVEKGRTDLFVHLGDGEQELDDLRAAFAGLALLSVRGNCDLFSTAPDHLLFEEGGIRLFACHGHSFSVRYSLDGIRSFARSNGVRVALFGHTHVPHAEQRGKVFLFNPGSCGRCYTGPDTYGLLTLENGKVTAYEHKEVPKQ